MNRISDLTPWQRVWLLAGVTVWILMLGAIGTFLIFCWKLHLI